MGDFAGFDLDDLLQCIKARKYDVIGTGSGRKVFDLNNGYVAKVAKNYKGLAQNKTEYEISSIDGSVLFAKVPIISDDYQILIMEKVDRVDDFYMILKYYNVQNTRDFLRLEEIKYICKEYNLVPIDLCRKANWGMIKGCPVIIDYGYTWKVKRKYYMPF